MATYQTLSDGSLHSNGTFIPINDYRYARALQEVEDGISTIIPYSEPAKTENDYLMFVQLDILDKQAQDRGYDNIFTAVTYADEPVVEQFQTEGLAFREWRSLVWAACYVILADVQAGNREAPTFEELEQELPVLNLS